MAKSKAALLKEAEELNLDVSEDATNAEIEAAIAEAKGSGSDEQDQPEQKPAKANNSAQARRDAHYFEDGVTEEHEKLGAQFGVESTDKED